MAGSAFPLEPALRAVCVFFLNVKKLYKSVGEKPGSESEPGLVGQVLDPNREGCAETGQELPVERLG